MAPGGHEGKEFLKAQGILADTVLCRVGFSRRWEVALGVTGKPAELRYPLG